MSYTSKYISRNDIPVQIPDDFSDEEKREALAVAESAIEADLNDGQPLPQQDISVLVTTALKQKGTCELAKGAEAPDDTALGDLSDTGSDKVDYAHEAFCDEYDELVEKLRKTGNWPSAGGTTIEPYTYTTDKPSRERP